jgi:hypothetical protein
MRAIEHRAFWYQIEDQLMGVKDESEWETPQMGLLESTIEHANTMETQRGVSKAFLAEEEDEEEADDDEEEDDDEIDDYEDEDEAEEEDGEADEE